MVNEIDFVEEGIKKIPVMLKIRPSIERGFFFTIFFFIM
jgi:hypothetical protein